MNLISLNDAVQIIQQHIPPQDIELLSLEDASGKVLVKNATAREAHPAFNHSTVNGFAVKWTDIAKVNESSSVMLDICGKSEAGAPFNGPVEKGTAVRVDTGALLPKGTDTVVPIENTLVNDHELLIKQKNVKGDCIRTAGSDFKRGEILCKAGTFLTPGCIGLLASQGYTEIDVIASPKVSIVVTGSELVPFDLKPEPGQMRDANSSMLKTAVFSSGADLAFHTRTGDNINAVRQAINKAAESANIIIVSGGISDSPQDIVKEAAREAGFVNLFWGVKQKPGQSFYLAKKDQTLLFGLPENLVLALNCYAYYIHPVLQQIQGKPQTHQTRSVIMGSSIKNTEDLSLFLRLQISTAGGKPVAILYSNEDPYKLTSIGKAEGYVLLNKGQSLTKGRKTDLVMYPWALY